MPTLKQPLECYIVLYQKGGLTLGLVPGDGVVVIPPEDPEWGKWTGILDSAQALAQAALKNPAISRKVHALLEEMLKPAAAEITNVLSSRIPVHA